MSQKTLLAAAAVVLLATTQVDAFTKTIRPNIATLKEQPIRNFNPRHKPHRPHQLTHPETILEEEGVWIDCKKYPEHRNCNGSIGQYGFITDSIQIRPFDENDEEQVLFWDKNKGAVLEHYNSCRARPSDPDCIQYFTPQRPQVSSRPQPSGQKPIDFLDEDEEQSIRYGVPIGATKTKYHANEEDDELQALVDCSKTPFKSVCKHWDGTTRLSDEIMEKLRNGTLEDELQMAASWHDRHGPSKNSFQVHEEEGVWIDCQKYPEHRNCDGSIGEYGFITHGAQIRPFDEDEEQWNGEVYGEYGRQNGQTNWKVGGKITFDEDEMIDLQLFQPKSISPTGPNLALYCQIHPKSCEKLTTTTTTTKTPVNTKTRVLKQLQQSVRGF